MYNDYYLEQINNKLSITNNNLQNIINNQEAIIQNQEILISGDQYFREKEQIIRTEVAGIEIVLSIILLYNFIRGCFRC